MRICNGPQLRVPRAGLAPGRRRWSWSQRFGHDAHDYDEYLARERARIRALPSVSVADRKRPTTNANRLKPGVSFRLVDGHGRSYGQRLTAPCTRVRLIDGPPLAVPCGPAARVRLVDRQPEDYHSLVSRMLKRAHRLILQTQI